jgi:phosphoenolpyruvate carboxykinase (ATP)
VVLHDDAFQIDITNNICRGWEPTFFDKTDSREPDSPDWKYAISLMNHTIIEKDGKRLPLGLDVRNPNGRALISRDVIGKSVNRCSFPRAVTWLMKDTCLPPIIKIVDMSLAVAMGATLMTERNKAENISAEELNQLVFEPFANPFRIYELWRDVEAFMRIAETDCEFYSLNSKGYWKYSDTNLSKIPLQTSLTLQTAILTDVLEWEPWEFLDGTMIPTKESVEKILPGYYDMYDHKKIGNLEEYKMLFFDRMNLRQYFLKQSDVYNKPKLLNKLVNSFNINI